MLFFLLLVFKITKKVAAAITTSATAYSAISLLYLHIINIPMHVICRATTDDNGRRRPCRTDVGVRRRAVCERALTLPEALSKRWNIYDPSPST